jgi:hypothetical protein
VAQAPLKSRFANNVAPSAFGSHGRRVTRIDEAVLPMLLSPRFGSSVRNVSLSPVNPGSRKSSAL